MPVLCTAHIDGSTEKYLPWLPEEFRPAKVFKIYTGLPSTGSTSIFELLGLGFNSRAERTNSLPERLAFTVPIFFFLLYWHDKTFLQYNFFLSKPRNKTKKKKTDYEFVTRLSQEVMLPVKFQHSLVKVNVEFWVSIHLWFLVERPLSTQRRF